MRQTASRALGEAVLDDPVGASLGGAHAHLARRAGRVAAYQPGVAMFTAVPAEPTVGDWADVVTLLGDGAFVDLFSAEVAPPDDWPQVVASDGLQLVGPEHPIAPATDPAIEVVELGEDDVPEMMELVLTTRPGPFWERTLELGTYLGIRDGGALVAMGGERLRPPGFAELSAVCVAPGMRGRGYAAGIVRALAGRVQERGERPFLHVIEGNTAALGLYRGLGFEVRRTVLFHGYRTPGKETR